MQPTANDSKAGKGRWPDQTSPAHQQKGHAEPTAFRGGKGPYGHLRQVMPDKARADAERKPKPGVTASTTGIHHPIQPSVWAQDATSSPGTPAQHHFAQPPTSSSSHDQGEEPWPPWGEVAGQTQRPPRAN